MNAWQICGGVISVLGTVLMLFGAHIQAKVDQIFQSKVEGYVADQKVFDAPNLIVLGINNQADGTTLLKVKNIGKRPAFKVKVIFTEDSVPNAFVSNLISGTQEIPGSVDYAFSLNIFSGINLMLKTPNLDPVYADSLREAIRKYEANEAILIPRFYLEYFDGQERIISPTYSLVIDKKHPIYLGKD